MQNIDTDEENELERALRLAANDPASRPDFYRVLLESNAYVIGRSSARTSEAETMDSARMNAAGGKMEIQRWMMNNGKTIIPFFSSVEMLRHAVMEEESYFVFPVRSLFELTQGEMLVLNPHAPYGKEFLSSEIAALLAEGINCSHEVKTTHREARVLLGQPEEYPFGMVDALTRFFSSRSQVKAAYLMLMQDLSQDEEPHLIVGIQMEGDIEVLFGEAGSIAAETSPNGGGVDLFRIEKGDEGLSRYFLNNVKPFYEATWGAKLWKFSGAGHA